MTSTKEVIRAYRQLYKNSLRAVQYSKPARFTARDRLRHVFRSNPSSLYEPTRINATLEFLQGASQAKGLEHKILKNLLYVWAARAYRLNKPGVPDSNAHAYDEFDRSVRLLDETMGTCISSEGRSGGPVG